MTSVRTYSMEKERAIKEIQAGIPEVRERMDAAIIEIQTGEKEVERRMAADVIVKQKDAARFALDFWEGD